jgi:hypothetical protein
MPISRIAPITKGVGSGSKHHHREGQRNYQDPDQHCEKKRKRNTDALAGAFLSGERQAEMNLIRHLPSTLLSFYCRLA